MTEIQNDKNTIEIELNPDAVDMRVTTLFDLYRYACYDRIKMKEIIPENLRKFDMDVMVFHVPLKYYNTAISSKSLKKKFDYKKLSDNKLQSYRRDIEQYGKYVSENKINYLKVTQETIIDYMEYLREEDKK